MADANGNGNGHGRYGSPGGQIMLAGIGLAVGIMVTFATASLYLGGTFERVSAIGARIDSMQRRLDVIDQSGAVRQIEINTTRLNQIEAQGSPQTATLKESLSNVLLRLNHLDQQVAGLPEADAAVRRDFAGMAANIMQNRQMIDAVSKELRPREFWEGLSARVSTLDAEVKDLMDTRTSGVVQWGTLIGRIATVETRSLALQDEINMARQRITQHEQDDNEVLRERARGLRVPAKETP